MVERTEEYKEVKFLIERWKTLKATSDQLMKAISKSTEEMETQRIQIQKYTEVRVMDILYVCIMIMIIIIICIYRYVSIILDYIHMIVIQN